MKKTLVVPFLLVALLAPGAAHAAAPAPIVATQSANTLAAGITLTAFERLYPTGWVRGWLLEADLSKPGVSAGLISAPAVTAAEPLSAMAAKAGAMVAVNGDFFDINNTKIPLGPVVQNGQLLKSAPTTWAAGVSADRLGQLIQVALEGTVTLPTGAFPLASVNQYTVPDWGIGLYTPLWTAPRTGAAFGSVNVREVVVKGGKVASVGTAVGTGPIAADSFVLVGREDGADRLAALKVGDPVAVAYKPNPALPFAVGGGLVLVKDGQVQKLDDRGTKPRTAIGFTQGGRKMLLLAVDGRSEESGGLTLLELGSLMQSLGAATALELDGGGSTTLVARPPGAPAMQVINRPSDGQERRIPNGVGVYATPGSGKAASLRIQPASILPGADRLFPGLTRQLKVQAYDDRLFPVQHGTLEWGALITGAGAMAPGQVFKGIRSGREVIWVRSGAISGDVIMQVLDPLDRVEVSPALLRPEAGRAERFVVQGYDSVGRSAPVDPADIQLTYDQTALQVEPAPDGSLQVTQRKPGVAQVQVSVLGKVSLLTVASPFADRVATGFEDLKGWSFQRYPDTVGGSLTSVTGRLGKALKLTYSFKPGSTRAAYAQSDVPLALPGEPARIGLWVKGDGNGAWLRSTLVDAAGQSYTVDLARYVDWTDWRYVEGEIPAGVAYPVSLSRIYPVETDARRAYSGELLLDELTAREPLPAPVLPQVQSGDAGLLRAGALPADRWKFGLISGQDISADEPEAALGRVRQTLREAMKARPEFLLIGRGYTTSTGERDMALARQVLAQEVGVPVYWVGDGQQVVDVKGTRFVLLDTLTGALHTAGFDQWLTLQAALAQAKTDPAIRRVVVVGDRTPTGLADHREGQLLRRWLTEFAAAGEKPVAYVAAPGGGQGARWTEGVPYYESLSPTGLTLFGISEKAGEPWLTGTR